MRSDKRWVVVWAVPKNPMDVPCWMMVKHAERGWELPGGELLESEENDIAALRELYEETGCLGIAIAEDDSIIEKYASHNFHLRDCIFFFIECDQLFVFK